jgi:hypothetical protein
MVVVPGQSAPTATGVEIYYGARNVTPRPAAAPVMTVIPAPYFAPEPSRPRIEPPVFVPIIPTPAPAAAPAVTRASAEQPAAPSSPLVNLFGAVLDRAIPGRSGGISLPQVVIIREPAPAAPAPLPASLTAQPQVVVVREGSGSSHSNSELMPVLALVGGAGGMACLGLAAAGVYALRRPTAAPAATVAATTASAAPPPLATVDTGPKLMGTYSIGEIPRSAERFDMGPSIEDEQATLKRREEEQAAAVIADVLARNLEMFAAFDADEPAAPAASAETMNPTHDSNPTTVPV